MIRILVTIIAVITCFVFQGTVFAFLGFSEVVPNLCLILATSLGLMRGKKTGLLVGFFSGLLMDLFSGSYLGFYSMLLMYLGFYAGNFNKVFYAEDIKLPILILLSSDFMYGFVNYIFLFLLRGRTNIIFYIRNITLPECVYTALMMIVMYPIILLIDRSFIRAEKRRNKEFGK